jgi:hypothetical protein
MRKIDFASENSDELNIIEPFPIFFGGCCSFEIMYKLSQHIPKHVNKKGMGTGTARRHDLQRFLKQKLKIEIDRSYTSNMVALA